MRRVFSVSDLKDCRNLAKALKGAHSLSRIINLTMSKILQHTSILIDAKIKSLEASEKI